MECRHDLNTKKIVADDFKVGMEAITGREASGDKSELTCYGMRVAVRYRRESIWIAESQISRSVVCLVGNPWVSSGMGRSA